MRGVITGYNIGKGWGFIQEEGREKERFFHATNSKDFKPALGLAVEYDLAPAFRMGQAEQAINLRKVESVGAESGKAGA